MKTYHVIRNQETHITIGMQCKYKFTINEMTKVELNIIFKIRNILTPITKNKKLKKI